MRSPIKSDTCPRSCFPAGCSGKLLSNLTLLALRVGDVLQMSSSFRIFQLGTLKTMEMTIAIVSDLHCHHSSMVPAETMLLSDADRQPSSHHPVEALLELIREQSLVAKILVAPGDLTNRVDRQGLISGWDFIRQIASQLKSEFVAATPGNHDVKSHDPSGEPFAAVRSLMPEFPLADPAALTGFWANGFCIVELKSVQDRDHQLRGHTSNERGGGAWID